MLPELASGIRGDKPLPVCCEMRAPIFFFFRRRRHWGADSLAMLTWGRAAYAARRAGDLPLSFGKGEGGGWDFIRLS